AENLRRLDLGKADDRVERRPQLVRYVGKEGGFRVARRLRLVPRLGQMPFSILDIAEITEHENEPALAGSAAADAQPAPVGETQFLFRGLQMVDLGVLLGGAVLRCRGRTGQRLDLVEYFGEAGAGDQS